MIDSEKILKYIKSRGGESTIENINKLIENYDRTSLMETQKKRFRYEIWDKKSSINDVSADTIIKSRGYKISNAYLIFVDDVLTYFQDHNPNNVGYESMTKKEAEKIAIEFIDKKVEENTDNIMASYIISKILSGK